IQLNDDFLLTRNEYNIKICITNSQNGLLFDSDVVSGRMTWREAIAENNILLFERNPQDYIVMSNETTNGNLCVSIVIPRSDLLLRISKVKYITYSLVVCCIIIIIMISTKLSKNIASPIKELQDKMEEVEKGKYETFEDKTNIFEINGLIYSYNNMVERIRNLIEKVYVAEIKQKNAKLLALQTQINPHMLYNTLEAIRMKAIINDEDEIADMIKIMAQMFRMALSDTTPCYRIKNDIEYAEKFIALQNIRLPDMFYMEVRLDDKIEEASIIPLIIQPLVENSIEHGYRGGNIPLHMILSGKIVEGNDISITLQDDGKGMEKEQIAQIETLLSSTVKAKLQLDHNESRNSIGMRNILERIQLYYGDRYYLHIVRSDETGTVVEVRIPGQW
ncbi:MAG: histidine kinase, partial [Lachnospiraceae bacterium]|nr:histidine kinase [Lachnospiraceae bacterium]